VNDLKHFIKFHGVKDPCEKKYDKGLTYTVYEDKRPI
jgi:hypothetical protein